MKRFFGLVLLAGLFISGCSYRVVDFTIISTKNVDLSKAGTFTRGKARVEGQDVAHIILIIPTGRADMEEAIDRALEKTPGAVALVDGVVYSKAWTVILYGQTTILVEGTPLINPALAMNSNEVPDYSIVKMDRHGKVKDYEEISEQEYLAKKADISKGSEKQYFDISTELK